MTPDPYCADLLLQHAGPFFPAEIVSGPGWIVRLEPPPSGAGWIPDLLSLVERWLQSIPLPCAKVLYGGHSYLIRPSVAYTQPPSTPQLDAVLALEPPHQMVDR